MGRVYMRQLYAEASLAGRLSDHCQLRFNQAFLKIMADRLRVADDRFASLLY